MNSGVFKNPNVTRRFERYDPIAPPYLPSHLNDEFEIPLNNIMIPNGWQNVGSQSPLEVVSGGGDGLYVRSPTSTALTSVMFERPLPPGPFTVATRIHNMRQSNWHPTGIYIASSVSDRRHALNIFQPDTTTWYKQIQREVFSAKDTRTFVGTIANWWMQFAFLRFCYNGTTLSFEVSPDGVYWTWAFSEAMTAHFGSDLPDRFGIQMRSERSDDNGYGVWSFVRYFPEAYADIGRVIMLDG